jgi:hypothetical protein
MRAPWERGVRIQTTQALSTTGGTVWAACQALLDFLEAESDAIGLMRPGVQVGTGICMPDDQVLPAA